MIKNLNDVKDKIDEIRELIPSFDTDERKEIKKNNKIINDYVLELLEIKKVLLDVIREKKEMIVPVTSDDFLKEDNLELKKKFERVIYLSNNDYVSKLKIDKNLYEIRYSGSLDTVNENIISLINKFLLIDIKLDSDNFKYSLSLYKYMDFFFKNLNDLEFNKMITNLFDSLYWECPDLVYHIYLSFMLLLDKYKDKFEVYIKGVNGVNNYDNELCDYLCLKKEIDDKINCCESLVYNKFVNNEYRLDDYLCDSIFRKDLISKYVDYDKYRNYSDDDRNYFYEQINGMYLDFCEYLNLSKYKFLIDKVRDIYSSKGSYTGSYASIKKNLKGLDKQREKMNSKLFSLSNRVNGRTKGILFNKYGSLFNKVNKKITEIIDVYNKYDEEHFINDVIVKLNDDSNCYDALKIYENNYGYLVKILEENNCSYDEFIDFLYSPYLSICKSVAFIDDIDIKEKLINKYDLFDMNFNLTDENKLSEELKYIMRLWCFDKGNIDLDKFKLIMNIDKIKSDEA